MALADAPLSLPLGRSPSSLFFAIQREARRPNARGRLSLNKTPMTGVTRALEGTHVIDASLQKSFVCHPSRFLVRVVISRDFCARSHVGSLPASFGAFRACQCLQSQKQHKPWQLQRTHVSDAALQKCFVCHSIRFRCAFRHLMRRLRSVSCGLASQLGWRFLSFSVSRES